MSKPELCNVPLWTGQTSVQAKPSGYCMLPKGHAGDHCLLKVAESQILDPGDSWKPMRDLPLSQDDAF